MVIYSNLNLFDNYILSPSQLKIIKFIFYVVEELIKNGGSQTTTQVTFCKCFVLSW